MKFRSVRAEMFHADGQTEGRTDRRNEGNSRFSQFLRTLLKTSQLMLYKQIIAVCSIMSIQNAQTLRGQNVEFFFNVTRHGTKKK
jgi:hypothetical protein